MPRRLLVLLVLWGPLLGCDGAAPSAPVPPDAGGAPGVAEGTDPQVQQVLAQVEAMRDVLESQESPVEIEIAIGSLYYEAGRYLEAVDWYRRGLEHARPALAAREALIRDGVRPAPPAAPECAPRGGPGAFARAAAWARTLTEAGRPAAALACYDVVKVPVVQALARRGAAWSLLDQRERALADLDRALALAPDDPEALYLTGAAVYGVGPRPEGAVAQKGRQAWERFLAVAPEHPQAEAIRANLAALEDPEAPQAEAAREGAVAEPGAAPRHLEPAPAPTAPGP